MLVKATGALAPDFHLLTLGRSCHYLAGTPQEFYLFDPGLSVHIPMLLKRLNERGFSLKNCRGVILTHLHADRAGGIPYLKQQNSDIQIIASHAAKSSAAQDGALKAIFEEDLLLSNKFEIGRDLRRLGPEQYFALFKIDKSVADSAQFPVAGGINVRVLAFPGHSKESLAYLVQPYEFLIADEGIGYFNGKDLAAPGFDDNVDTGLQALVRFGEIDFTGICMCNGGVLTAQLVRKHMGSVAQNTRDILDESKRALAAVRPPNEVKGAIFDAFYKSTAPDPLLKFNLERSFASLWRQLLER